MEKLEHDDKTTNKNKLQEALEIMTEIKWRQSDAGD